MLEELEMIKPEPRPTLTDSSINMLPYVYALLLTYLGLPYAQQAPFMQELSSHGIQSLFHTDLHSKFGIPPEKAAVIERFIDQDRVGLAKYGTTLHAFCGRDFKNDALFEITDGFKYISTLIVEGRAEEALDVLSLYKLLIDGLTQTATIMMSEP